MGRTLRKGSEIRLGRYLLALARSSDPHPMPSVLKGVWSEEGKPTAWNTGGRKKQTSSRGKRPGGKQNFSEGKEGVDLGNL